MRSIILSNPSTRSRCISSRQMGAIHFERSHEREYKPNWIGSLEGRGRWEVGASDRLAFAASGLDLGFDLDDKFACAGEVGEPQDLNRTPVAHRRCGRDTSRRLPD